MEASQKGIDFIKSEEGLRLNAYQDGAGIWTIGYGTIRYKSGEVVKKGDTITELQAEDLLAWEVEVKTGAVSDYVKSVSLNQNQYDSLVSFAYNVGTGALHGSTLLKRVLNNPNDAAIKGAFLMWDKIRVDGELVESKGLKARRQREADFYFS